MFTGRPDEWAGNSRQLQGTDEYKFGAECDSPGKKCMTLCETFFVKGKGDLLLYHDFHLDWKTENGRAFSSQGILIRLDKTGKFTENTGKS